ncbi:fibronectin type III domain-containing protein [Paenibacillus periandrae]|uniref:fibronectin type III domain-containing protein n=1 Tax=Paenibacillus periandrae TaxID=1761741 RepID=UPI001F08EEE9
MKSKVYSSVLVSLLLFFSISSSIFAQIGDYDPPVFKSIHLSSNTADPNQPVTITADASDESGIAYINLSYQIEAGGGPGKNLHIIPNGDGVLTTTFLVSTNDRSGKYNLQNIIIQDTQGNIAYIYHSETQTGGNNNGIYMNLSSYSINVSGTVTDTSPPLINRISVSPTNINGNGIVQVKASITDELTGVAYAGIRYQLAGSNVGKSTSFFIDGNGDYVGTLFFSPSDPSGTYEISSIYAQDMQGNMFTIYNSKTNTDQSTNISYRDLSQYNIVVEGSVLPDLKPPVLNNLTISSTNVRVGDSVTVTADIYDESDQIIAYGNYKPINSTRLYDKSLNFVRNNQGLYIATIYFGPNDDKGVYVLDRIGFQDNQGNAYSIYHSTTNTSQTANYRYEDLSRYNINFETGIPTWPSENALSVTNSTYTSADIEWKPAISQSEINHYNIYKNSSLIQTVGGNVYGYHVDGLSPGETYKFMVEANNKDGNSVNNPIVTVTTSTYNTNDITPPYWLPYARITVADVTYNSLTLSWDPATDNVGVKQYHIYRDGELYASIDAKSTSLNISNLIPNTTVKFDVKATDYAGNISTSGPSLTVKLPNVIPQTPQVSLQTNEGFIQVGSTIELNVAASSASDLYGFLMKLDYDPSKFKMTQIGLHSDFGIENVDAILGKDDSLIGHIDFSGVLLGNVPGKYNNLKLATIKFTALQNGNGKFELSTNSQLSDSYGHISNLNNPVSLSVHIGDLDFNNDGLVNLSDLVIISHHNGAYKGQPMYDSIYDLNNDGVINSIDIQYVADKITKN